VKKLVIVFKNKKYFEKVRCLVERRITNFPTTSFNEQKMSMVIKKGLITHPWAIGVGVLQISDSNKREIILEADRVRSINRTSPACFLPRSWFS
jgi:hypothetical protein